MLNIRNIKTKLFSMSCSGSYPNINLSCIAFISEDGKTKYFLFAAVSFNIEGALLNIKGRLCALIKIIIKKTMGVRGHHSSKF